MNFNEKELYKNYKNIIKTCLLDGYVTPYLITTHNIPLEYKFTVNEMNKLIKNLPDKIKETLKINNINKRSKELKFFKENNINLNNEDSINKVNLFYEKELKLFLKKYPRYNSILNKNKDNKNIGEIINMKINTLELYKQYKQIKTTCLINGIPVIDILPIPEEYDFKSWEMDLIKKRINPNDYNKLQKEYIKQKKTELQIQNNRHPKYNNLLEYKEAQIKEFIKKFPQFNNIIL